MLYGLLILRDDFDSNLCSGTSMSDIYDLAWSPDGQYICAGLSIDNAARIWNVTTRALLFCLGIENLYFP